MSRLETVNNVDALTSTGAWKLEEVADGIAVLVFDLPGEKVNKLSEAVLRDLEKILSELEREEELKALIVEGGKEDSGTFIAGADIEEIRAVENRDEAVSKASQGQSVLARFASLPAVTIAAIHGNCLGGGLELALACDLRIASHSPRTQLGFPEVQLGILPGFGGTQRLPRLIGLARSLPAILTAKPLDVGKAKRLGVVDGVVYPGLLRTAAIDLAKTAIEKGGKRYRPRRPHRPWYLRCAEALPPVRALIRRTARKGILKRVGSHYPAPLKALDAAVDGYGRSLEEGLKLEARLVGELVVSRTCKNLIDLFLSSQQLRKESSATGDKPLSCVKDGARIGLLGAGIMGGGLAALMARKGFRVRMKDIHTDALQTGLRRVQEIYRARVKRRRMTRREMENCLAALSVTTDYSGFEKTRLVVEAVVENMDVKQKVLGEIEAKLPDDAIFASNTSALSITELQRASQRPERVVGLHFFNPVERMPLVEVIHGADTAPEVVAAAEEVARKLGKIPVRSADAPGFIVNRVLGPYLNEAVRLFEEGYSPTAIDEFVRGFGMPMGPFELMDEVGLDVAAKVGAILHAGFGERARPPELLSRFVEEAGKGNDGALGKKTGKGFYLHGGKKKAPNPGVLRWGGTEGRDFRPQDHDLWLKRLVYPMVNEAARVLEENVAENAAAVDLAMVMGTGFAPFRGGPLRYADSLGLTHVVEALRALREPRLRPCELFENLARKGVTFHSLDSEGATGSHKEGRPRSHPVA